MNNKKSTEEYRREYRLLAEKVRKAARTAATEKERAELLARAKLWDLLADRCLHHPDLHPDLNGGIG
jgi:hypothetical protein